MTYSEHIQKVQKYKLCQFANSFDILNNPCVGEWNDYNMHGDGTYADVGTAAGGRERLSIFDRDVMTHMR